MAARKYRFTWPIRRAESEPTDVDENYQPTAAEPKSEFAPVDSDIRGDSGPQGPDHQSSVEPKWLSELQSPYGLSDVDGTLKQLDSVNWHRAAQLKRRRSKRFIPQTGHQSPSSGTGRWQNGRTAEGAYAGRPQGSGTLPGTTKGPHTVSAGSTWLLQLGAAVVLTLLAVYAHDSSTPLAVDARSAYQRVFATDYTKTAAPAIASFLKSHNISVPAFLSQSGAMQLHVPLAGKIVQDYSSTHPQMVIAGSKDEPVVAAGSGIVTRVVPLQGGFMVVIDHGTIGSSYYFGLGSASVRTGESVESGEVIGKLPNTASPRLMFEIEQGGKAIDPHNYIVFKGTKGGA